MQSVAKVYSRHGEALGTVEYRVGQRSAESRTTVTGDRFGELGRVLENWRSKVIEEGMTRRLHIDLK
jgi:hypothetical protein